MATKTIPQTSPLVAGPTVAMPRAAASPAGAAGVAGMGPMGVRAASASLYVGDLEPEVSEALLYDTFNAVGPVASVRVCRDAATRRSLGYAYVNFHRVEDAERALDTMNFKKIRSRQCRIMWSHRDPSLRKSGLGNIFVKNLDPEIDNKLLYDTFSQFGNILSCKVAMNKETNTSLGYGFVHFETEASAVEAIKNCNGKTLADGNGKILETGGGEKFKIIVTAFKSKKERGGGDVSYTNVYVKHIPVTFTKAEVEEKLNAYGPVDSTYMPLDRDTGKPTGVAIVNFKDAKSAKDCVDGLNEEVWEGKKIFAARHQKKAERQKELQREFERKKLLRYKRFEGVNLYVKNLSDSVDDTRLADEFSKYGIIASAKVMMENGKSKGFGFVCFQTPEEAQKAQLGMNNYMLDGKPLYVAMAQRKEQRKQHLEAQFHRNKMGGMPAPHLFPQGPMLYQGMPQRMMYPPQRMMAPGGRFPQGGLMSMRQPQAMTHQLMPMQQPRQQGQQPRRRGNPNGRQQQNRGGQAGQANFKFNNQARNQPPVEQAQPRAAPLVEQAPPATNQMNTLASQLNAAPSEEAKKNILGEALFPQIQNLLERVNLQQKAGKITGMLLEMDNNELINLLESRQALDGRIKEALDVLRSSKAE